MRIKKNDIENCKQRNGVITDDKLMRDSNASTLRSVESVKKSLLKDIEQLVVLMNTIHSLTGLNYNSEPQQILNLLAFFHGLHKMILKEIN